MLQLTADQHNRLVQTERVILIATGTNEQVIINKGFLALHSTFFAQVVDKPSAVGEDGQATFEVDSAATAIKVFVRWCYEGHFRPINVATAGEAQLNQRKMLLIDLWIFGEKYGIPAIQNEAIEHLAQVLTTHPHLLTREDVEYILTRTPVEQESNPLKHLLVITIIFLLEVGAKGSNADAGLKAYEQCAQGFPGFMSLMLKWQRAWLIVNTSGKSRASVERLGEFVAREGVERYLVVEEGEVEEWVRRKYGLGEEREVEVEVEVIVIDDD